MKSRSFGRWFAIVAVMLVSYSAAGAASGGKAASPPGPDWLVGSWAETTSAGDTPPFQGLITFDGVGGVIGSYQGNINTGGPAPLSFSAAHGKWIYEGRRTFSTTSLQLVSGFDGRLIFVNRIRQRITLSKSRDSYTSVVRAEFYAPDGTLLFASDGTTAARRIDVERLP